MSQRVTAHWKGTAGCAGSGLCPVWQSKAARQLSLLASAVSSMESGQKPKSEFLHLGAAYVLCPYRRT